MIVEPPRDRNPETPRHWHGLRGRDCVLAGGGERESEVAAGVGEAGTGKGEGIAS